MELPHWSSHYCSSRVIAPVQQMMLTTCCNSVLSSGYRYRTVVEKWCTRGLYPGTSCVNCGLFLECTTGSDQCAEPWPRRPSDALCGRRPTASSAACGEGLRSRHVSYCSALKRTAIQSVLVQISQYSYGSLQREVSFQLRRPSVALRAGTHQSTCSFISYYFYTEYKYSSSVLLHALLFCSFSSSAAKCDAAEFLY